MAATTEPDRERIEAGWLLAGAGALLLLVSLFLDWYESGLSAWTVFEALDLVLAACAVVAIGYAARTAGFRGVGQAVALLAGAVAFVVVGSQLIDPPPAAFDQDREAGGWLGLSGSALMLIGALLARTGMSFAVVVERRRPGTAAPTDPVPPRGPASPPGGSASSPGAPTTGTGETRPLPPQDPRA